MLRLNMVLECDRGGRSKHSFSASIYILDKQYTIICLSACTACQRYHRKRYRIAYSPRKWSQNTAISMAGNIITYTVERTFSCTNANAWSYICKKSKKYRWNILCAFFCWFFVWNSNRKLLQNHFRGYSADLLLLEKNLSWRLEITNRIDSNRFCVLETVHIVWDTTFHYLRISLLVSIASKHNGCHIWDCKK